MAKKLSEKVSSERTIDDIVTDLYMDEMIMRAELDFVRTIMQQEVVKGQNRNLEILAKALYSIK